MPIVKIEDHTAQAEALLLEQYQGKPRIRALLFSFIRRCQELENAAWNVIVKRLIDNAVGAQLDAIGRIVGAPRRGRNDPTYRIWITVRIAINGSHGFPHDLIRILRLVASGFHYAEFQPAWFRIEFDAMPALFNELFGICREAKPAGVGFGMLTPATTKAEALLFKYTGQADVQANAVGYTGQTGFGTVSYMRRA